MVINNFKGVGLWNNPSQNLNDHLKVSISDKESFVIQNSTSNKISFSDDYQPDFSILDTTNEGETIHLTSWRDDELIAFDKLSTDKIINNVDFTNTTKDELYAVLTTLARRGDISTEAFGVAETVGLDNNLRGGKTFNALEYFEKSLQGMRNLPIGLQNSEIPQQVKSTFNAISAIYNMKKVGQTVMSVNETV